VPVNAGIGVHNTKVACYSGGDTLGESHSIEPLKATNPRKIKRGEARSG